jgi:EAL domain-containing protein (putative c-di-GMP-specific phosphodiesterase class I)/DNA-binding response OmpR family regulator
MEKRALISLINSTKKLQLLLVEDDAVMRETTIDFLTTFFNHIIWAEDGADGWEKFQKNRVDIVLTDINMPKMNGLELISKIRQHNEDVPIIILSAHTESKYFLESIRYSVDGYLLKPFDVEQFLFLVAKIAKRLQNAQKLLEYQNHLEEMVEQKTRELEYRCMHEFYTDLPNAIMMREDLEKEKFCYMLLLDISNFSAINKEYGREFANSVIRQSARALEGNINKTMRLYKTESDRFMILLKDPSLKKMYDFCRQIVAFFDGHILEIDGYEIKISFNIGADKVREDITQSFVNCEFALERSKLLGSRHFEVYNDDATHFEAEKEALKWLKITRDLIIEEEIIPFFQPIQNIATKKVQKYEVLARGVYKGEIVTPELFIEASEKLGLSTSVTRIVLNKTFEIFKDREEEFSINLTKRDILEDYLFDFLEHKTKKYAIEPSRITFEILENITIEKNATVITNKINKLKDAGYKIAVDDFGVESSNLSRLLEMEFDYIKIDGLFIQKICTSQKKRQITEAIVSLAKTLGIKTVAEYVENEAIYEMIKKAGVDYAQGHYIAKASAELL